MSSGRQRGQLCRRGFLALAAPAVVAASSLSGVARAALVPERMISLYSIHTGEKLTTIYHADGAYQEASLSELNHILRDWRTDEVYPMETGLLDFLHDLHVKMDSSEPFHIISGYRSPKTNAKLRNKSKGVAKRSLHMRGMAVDISLPDRDLLALHRTAKSMQRGGVGLYRKSEFIHVDIGRVRSW